jgi:PAS domain S-box-containing protein
MEDASRETELLSWLDATSDGAWCWEVAPGRITVTDRWCATMGMAPPRPSDVDLWLGVVDGEGQERLRAWASRPSGRDLSLEARAATGEAVAFVVRRGRVVSSGADGRPLRVIGTDTIRPAADRPAVGFEDARYRDAVRAADVGAFDRNLSDGSVRASPECYRLHGLDHWIPDAEFVSRVNEADREAYLAAIDRATVGQTIRLDYRFRRPDEVERWYRLRGSVVQGPEGSRRFVGVVIDATELKRIEERLTTEHERLELVVDSSDGGFYDWNIAGGSLYVSPRFCAITGMTPEEAESGLEAWAQRVHPDDRERFLVDATRCLKTPQHFSLEYRLLSGDGTERWVRGTGRTLYGAGGTAIRAVGFVSDITAQKTDERRLRESASALDAARRRAELAAKAKADFLATMSHEIRTPLNGVIGMMALLLETPQTVEQRELAEAAQHAGDSLLAVVDDILDFSKIEAGRLEIEEAPVDLATCIEGALEVVAARAGLKGLDLCCTIAPEVPAWIVGDATRIRQVLLNLVGNAVKFTHRGSVRVEVALESQQADRAMVRVAVHDTGIGLPSDRLGRLFQPFTQADGSTTRKYGGTGLGLAISKRLVDAMGGRIWAESVPGRGSTFSFTLDGRVVDRPEGRAPDPPVDLSGRRWLIVGEASPTRQLTEHLLQSAGAEVESCATLSSVDPRPDHRPIDGLLYVWPLGRGRPDDGDLAWLAAVDAPVVLVAGLEAQVDEQLRRRAAGVLRRPLRAKACLRLLARVQESVGRQPDARRPGSAGVLGLAVGSHADRTAEGDRPRVLVAEDNVVNQRLVETLLRKLGYASDTVATGREAVEAVARHSYFLVLMDCRMPELDGFDATRLIRRVETETGRRPVPIVALTAGATEQDRQHCFEAGMDGFLAKPLRPGELKDVLDRWRETPPMAEAG